MVLKVIKFIGCISMDKKLKNDREKGQQYRVGSINVLRFY